MERRAYQNHEGQKLTIQSFQNVAGVRFLMEDFIMMKNASFLCSGPFYSGSGSLLRPLGGIGRRMKPSLWWWLPWWRKVKNKRKNQKQHRIKKEKKMLLLFMVAVACKTMSAYIPQELLFTEVLIRLPLKSLARFRCVSKSWKAQIDNLQFVKTHYKRTKDSDSAEVRILIGGSYCGTYKLFSINIHDILSFDLGEVCGRTKEIKISRKLKHGIYELHDFYGCQIIGSCYGLICLGLLSGTAPLALTFMNPLTRKKWDLPWFPRHYPGGTSHHYGFGYNEVTDDYILVVLAENPSKDVMIYSLNSNSWRVLDSPFEGATAFDDQLRGVFSGKALHWVMRDWDSMEIFVVAFDLQTEQFYCMMLPEYPGGSIHWKVCLGSSGGGLSAVFISMYPTYVVDMWVMRKYGDEESWFKYTLKLPICRLYTSVIPIALTKGYHHQILLQIMFESFNEGSNSLLLYNLRRRSATFLRNPVALSTLAACVCSGSLLLPSGGGARRRRKKPSFRWSWPSLNITQSLENINLLDPTGRSADEG